MTRARVSTGDNGPGGVSAVSSRPACLSKAAARPGIRPRALLAALGLLAASAPANAADPTRWRADCRIDERSFRLEFASASGDLDNEDMVATLVLPDRSSVQLPLTPGIFRPRSVVANQRSACKELGAYLIQDQIHKAVPPLLLLWLSVEDRPGWDQLSLVLIDLDAGKVLHQIEWARSRTRTVGRA